MISSPLATIYLVTTCHNADATLEETFASITKQVNLCDERGVHTFHLRYHVQDSCSTDTTLSIIKKWEKTFQELGWCTFSYTSEPDKNMYEGILKGFEALGAMEPESFMAWLNADDTLFPQCLQNIAHIAHTFPEISWLGGKVCNIDAQGNILVSGLQYYPQEFIALGLCNGFFWNYIQQEGTFFKKKLWDSAGTLNTTYRFIGDWLLWKNMAQKATYYTLDQPMGAFRQREGQLSSSGYDTELHTHTPFKELRVRFLKLLWKTRLFTTLTPAKILTKENTTFSLSTKKRHKPSKLYAIRATLNCYHLSSIVRFYDNIKKLFTSN